MCHDNEEWCKIWTEIGGSVQNWYEEFNHFLTPALKNLNNLHFNRLLLTKVYNVWAWKVQKSYVWWHSRLILNLKENWLVLPKMTWGTLQIFTRAHSKAWKVGLFLGPFIKNRKCMSLQSTEELCVMKIKNAAKIEENLPCQFKINMKNLMIFHPRTRKSQKIAL